MKDKVNKISTWKHLISSCKMASNISVTFFPLKFVFLKKFNKYLEDTGIEETLRLRVQEIYPKSNN